MSSNPMIPQGTLNRLRGSVNFVSNSQLNVTAPYLGKAGISLTLEGESTLMIPTMSGTVTSPEPYMMVSCVINLLKTQNLAAVFKAQMENTTLIGDFVVTPDASTLPTYYVNNAAIESVKDMPLNGEDAGFVITLKGYYIVNNALWNI
jgi:hypothetical protein